MLQPTTDQTCVNVSLVRTYPLREKWVCDVVAYRGRDTTYPLNTGYNIKRTNL